MESRIPVPTDNIFKFYALFGLLLFVFSCGSILYVTRSSNEVVFAVAPELDGLKQIAQPTRSDSLRIALLEKKLEITKADKNFFLNAVGIIVAVAVLLIVYGFSQWHTKVQPMLDRTTKAQTEIAELQLLKLQRELGINPPAKSEPNDNPKPAEPLVISKREETAEQDVI